MFLYRRVKTSVHCLRKSENRLCRRIIALSLVWIYSISGGRDMIDYRLSYLIEDSKEKYLLDQAAEMTKMRKMDLLLAIEKVNEVASDLFETEI